MKKFNLIDVKCPRCSNVKTYKSRYVKEIIDNSFCAKCKRIPDEFLDIFIKTGKYARKCFTCDKILFYKKRQSYIQSIKKHQGCHRCGNRTKTELERKKRREIWEPIVGYWNITYKSFVKIRKHWQSLSIEKQQELLSKTPLQRKYYWEHLKRANRVVGLTKIRKSLEKYKGKNHWIHRTKTWEKVFESIKWIPIYQKEDGNFKKLRQNKFGGIEKLLMESNDIIIDLNEVPTFSYKYRNKNFNYKTGIHIPSKNQSVEIKSAANINKIFEKYVRRWMSILSNKYNLRIIIYGRHKEIIIDKVFQSIDSLNEELNNLKEITRCDAYKK